ncbi:hypothetical protein [Pectobacterium polonicum]
MVRENSAPLETSLGIDLDSMTLDTGIIVGQFNDVMAFFGNPSIGVSIVT